MGPNVGNGFSGMEMGPPMQGNGPNVPQATEYTLQGVMRFLQTEWHRHERDRNAWEIENQEMRSRIANLEGQARRADATQKVLRKYVGILERKVKDQAAQLKGTSPADADADADAKKDRAAKIQEKLHGNPEKQTVPGVDGIEIERTDDEAHRQELKSFLDQCQSEFMYLMIAPANPLPPRDSPPLPMMEDLREVDPYGPQEMRQFQLPSRPSQNHVQEMNARQNPPTTVSMQDPTSNFNQKPSEPHPQVVVRAEEQPQYRTANDWAPISVSLRAANDSGAGPSQTVEALGSMHEPESRQRTPAPPQDPDGWDFSEGALPETAQSQTPSTSNRPDTDVFPHADYLPKSPGRPPGSQRRKSSLSKRRSSDQDLSLSSQKADSGNFKLRFGLRGHLNTVRTVIFSGGGSPGEPEICTAGDDGMIKRFHIPRLDTHTGMGNAASDLDVIANFTHRGHHGAVLSLTSWSPSPNFSTGGRAQGDGWIFSGGQDSTIRVWERGRVDPKATLEGHTDAVWALCVLPATLGAIFGNSSQSGTPDRILLVSGAADGSVRLWSVSAPPQLTSPQPGSNRGVAGRRARGNSMSSGSSFPNSPQPSTASNSPFHQTLVHVINRSDGSTASPTSIAPLGPIGDTFVVSYADAAVVVYDTRTGEQVGQMDSMETYDGTQKTSVNAVVATTMGLDQASQHHGSNINEDETGGGGPTGGRSMAGSGVEGTIITGHEDRFVRFFDANSGQCTYNMLAHPDAISSLSLSPDGRELVSAGHDASLRFWSLEKRSCVQEITSHRVMRGEGVCACVWSQDGKWVVSGGGDGVVKVFAR
ncbi:striatin Pro11 [Cordyceps fumosorosea ARSEF 2679]|uniref:Striatin Pro11 n=1 Tax=Cordyceps fumosorosea (strain ARSEF 2679) TaxID=1081104 RepID=A0A162JJD5_CORFA|nr:striatin Pro11 [Cordyceps fumosorosea ARSEF 2679]OAA69862.1 striatin Pro11 [Cordyceps fumosorosea ARSEF 2679]